MNFREQFFDDNGAPLAGGKLYSYEAGSTDALATYTDATLSVANTNPVTLDSAGRCSVWLLPQAYKLILKDADGNTIWTVDNVQDGGGILEGELAAGDGADHVGYGSGSVKDRLDAINYGRATVNVIAGSNITVSEADNPSGDSRDITIAAVAGGTAAMSLQKDGGAAVGPRGKMNAITGNNAALVVADDVAGDAVKLTIGATMAAEKDGANPVDARRRLNFKTGTFGSVAVTDNGAGDCIDVTVNSDGMKAQKAGGAILGGRAKLNLIEGANITLTVADAPADDRINVTIAASGASYPTQGTDYSALTAMTDPGGGYPAWGAYTQLIAATAYAGTHLIVHIANATCLAFMIGLGAGPTDSIYVPGVGFTYPVALPIPFTVGSGVKVSAKGYFGSMSANNKLQVIVLG